MRPAAFLDRDGTLIVEREYLADPAGVELLPGAAAGLRALAGAGYALVIITNQSGIGRGLYSEEAFQAVQVHLLDLLEREGVRIDGVYHCPHHPDFTGVCLCRKPGLALYRQAIEDLDLDPRKSIFVGDRLSDVAPARELGGKGILVLTGYGREESVKAGPDLTLAENLEAAAAALKD